MICVKSFAPPPVCKKEFFRYAGAMQDNVAISELAEEVLNELGDNLSFKVCYTTLPVNTMEDLYNLEAFSFYSKSLSKNLSGCSEALLFCATVGVEIDRFISKYSRLSPSRALMFQAAGTERIEALCDTFIKDFENSKGVYLTPRFSPGYGDFPLQAQKEIFALLDCSRKIGVTLNESFLMSPTKSVTAIAGITKEKSKHLNKCANCQNTDCAFRSTL